MFSENLKTLRKQKGFSQEELASRLHVVRQTISKWEKNLSVPDADTLIRLAEMKPVGQVHRLFSRPTGLQINILWQWDCILRSHYNKFHIAKRPF